jgi:beta-aspartyl-peptidase (threonine type)
MSEPTPFIIYPRLGSPDDSRCPLRPPGGLVLSGGAGHVPGAYAWMQRQLVGATGGPGGDIVVLRATPDDSYSEEVLKAAPFNSVQTICVPEDATPDQLDAAAAIVARAEGVFFSGGQQSRYVAWKGTALIAAVQAVYGRGGVVGGTSAGLAILGERIFDGRVATSDEVTTPALLGDPDNPHVTLTEDLFEFAPLDDVITDTHFRERDRFGRLVTLMARQPGGRILGIGVDEQTALCIDRRGIGHLERARPAQGAAYLLRGRGGQVRPGEPLGPVTVRVTRLDSTDETASLFDFRTWQGRGCLEYDVTVDAAQEGVYSADPYGG